MNDQKNSKFGIGFVFGAVLGSIAGMLFSPKSGAENREMVMRKANEVKGMIESGELQDRITEIFEDATDEGKKVYAQVRGEIETRLEKVQNIDWKEYQAMIEDVVNQVRDTTQTSSEKLAELKKRLLGEWEEVAKNTEKTAKKARRA